MIASFEMETLCYHQDEHVDKMMLTGQKGHNDGANRRYLRETPGGLCVLTSTFIAVPRKAVKKSFTFCRTACHSSLACVDGLSSPFLLTNRKDPDECSVSSRNRNTR